MKRILLAMALSLAMAVTVSAQGGRYIYDRYSGKDGVSAIYISPAMFRMMKTLPEVEIEDTDVDFRNIISTFDGMYILDVENAALVPEINSDVESFVKKGRYELLMETREAKEKMQIYISVDKDTVTDFMMLAVEEDEVSVISITGKMPLEKLQSIVTGIQTEIE